MMHWIYVLKCKNDTLYVGETKNLYSRLYQHNNKKGSKHTIESPPDNLIALYKVQSLYRFLQFSREIAKEVPNVTIIEELLDEFHMTEWNNKDWARTMEDFITEYLLSSNVCVNGGKFVNENKYSLKRTFENKDFTYFPRCHCGLPCDVHMKVAKVKNSKYYKIFFMCSLKNIWDAMREQFTVFSLQVPCSFYQECTNGLEYRIQP